MSNRRRLPRERVVPAAGVGPSGKLVMTGAGIDQKYEPRERSAEDAMLDPAAPGRHVWVAMSMHRLSEESAAATITGDGPVHLDVETLVSVNVGCWLCESVYTPEVATQRCSGQPPGELGYR